MEALSEREYLLLKERLLKKLKDALDSFVVAEHLANPNIQETDILYAEMEVLLDISASSALATEETGRGDFLDIAVASFDSMLDISLEEHLNLGNELEGMSFDLTENNKSLN